MWIKKSEKEIINIETGVQICVQGCNLCWYEPGVDRPNIGEGVLLGGYQKNLHAETALDAICLALRSKEMLLDIQIKND